MIHLFLDSNIWLSLYHFSADDLEQFEKLGKLVNSEIKLYIPQQTYDEVIRNRDAKLKDSFTSFEKFDFRFPVFCKNYEEYEDFHQKYESANFLSTHRIIAELSRYSDWTIDQINMLYVAAIENSQIHWIIHDDDVLSFYRELLKKYDGSEEAKQLIEIIGDNNS